MKDLAAAFSFPFRDPSWVPKFLIASLFIVLSVFGIGAFVIAGYLIELTQRVMRREEFTLPEWSDIGVKFITGFKFCVVYVVYLLPIILVIVPLIVLGIAAELSDQADLAALFVTVYLFAAVLLIVPYSIAFTVLLPIITYRFALNGRISEALDIGAVLRTFARNWQSTVLVALLIIGVQSLALIGLVAFIIGVIVTIFYSYAVSAYLHGMLYLEHAHKTPVA